MYRKASQATRIGIAIGTISIDRRGGGKGANKIHVEPGTQTLQILHLETRCPGIWKNDFSNARHAFCRSARCGENPTALGLLRSRTQRSCIASFYEPLLSELIHESFTVHSILYVFLLRVPLEDLPLTICADLDFRGGRHGNAQSRTASKKNEGLKRTASFCLKRFLLCFVWSLRLFFLEALTCFCFNPSLVFFEAFACFCLRPSIVFVFMSNTTATSLILTPGYAQP